MSRKASGVVLVVSCLASSVLASAPVTANAVVSAKAVVSGNVTGGDVPVRSVAQPLSAAARGKVALALVTADPSMQLPVRRVLRIQHAGQIRSYYCGPASGYMILRYLGAWRSRYTGELLSQTALASPAHMNTPAMRSTTWLSGRFALALNRWLGRPTYTQVPSPSAAVSLGAVRDSVGRKGRPLAADTVEIKGAPHYNGHPTTLTIGHWIAGYGYAAGGRTAYFADPATTVWRTVSPTFSYDTSSFTRRFLRHNGIAF